MFETDPVINRHDIQSGYSFCYTNAFNATHEAVVVALLKFFTVIFVELQSEF